MNNRQSGRVYSVAKDRHRAEEVEACNPRRAVAHVGVWSEQNIELVIRNLSPYRESVYIGVHIITEYLIEQGPMKELQHVEEGKRGAG